MTTQDSIIKTAYEVEHMSPSEIAQDQNLNEIAVKAKLMEISSQYRKDCGKEPETESRLNFTESQLEMVNAVIFEAAISAEHADGTIDWKIRSQNAQYIRDDCKGRKDVKSVLANNTFNILTISEKINNSNARANEAIRKLIDVSSQ